MDRRRPVYSRAVPVAFLLLAAALAALVIGDRTGTSAAAGTQRTATRADSCGPATLPTVAAVARYVASRIYATELAGHEVRSDLTEIEHSRALQDAVATDDGFSSTAAVTALVYSGTHIVRLRVTRGNRVLADVGGPAIVAPVSGIVRIHGKPIGRFVMSVQDDLGLQKLIKRYAGAQTVMTVAGQQIAGTLPEGSAKLISGTTVTVAGGQYFALELRAMAFPTGALNVWVLVPTSAGPPAYASCAAVAAAAMTHVAFNIANRFTPLSSGSSSVYGYTTNAVTNLLMVVRRNGRTVAATLTNVPRTLPRIGPLRVGRTEYLVGSFAPPTAPPGTEVYVLYHGP